MLKNGPPEMSIYKKRLAAFPKFNFVVEENLITISSLSHHYMILHAARLLIGLFFGNSSNLPAMFPTLQGDSKNHLKKPWVFIQWEISWEIP